MISRIKEAIGRVRAFLREVNVELHKCAWPSRNELMESTVVVIVSVLLLSAYVGFSDVLVHSALGVLVR